MAFLFLSLPATSFAGLIDGDGSLSNDDVNISSPLQKAFYDDATLNLNTALYIRQRAVKNPQSGKYSTGQGDGIKNQTANISVDYTSGYYKDVVGFDFWGETNLKLGQTSGQSEILYYDYSCGAPGKYETCEHSYVAFSVAAMKLKFGDESLGFKSSIGFTKIDSGTIKNSWGLNPHSYRGMDNALNIGRATFTYAWADRFKNDWSRDFKPMVNSWNQNNAAGLDDNGNTISKGKTIDYIHSLGFVYHFDKATVDLGYGEGKGYRRNWQVLLDRKDTFSPDLALKSKLYYQGARYIEDVSEISSPSTEYYVGLGLDLIHRNTTWSLGLSQNYAPDTKDYNFRLTPYANSDKREYQPTLALLEDFNVSGAHAIRAAVSYNFAGYNFPELTVGTGATYARHVVSDTSQTGDARRYGGQMRALDFNINYKVASGPAKGLQVTLLPAFLRSTDTTYKSDRNDIRLIVGYTFNLF
ncbi:OprD family porin [Salmonella enterica]|nr:OprD family porin [Salmonella enterica]